MGRISPGPTRWPPGAERRLVPAKSNLKSQTQTPHPEGTEDRTPKEAQGDHPAKTGNTKPGTAAHREKGHRNMQTHTTLEKKKSKQPSPKERGWGDRDHKARDRDSQQPTPQSQTKTRPKIKAQKTHPGNPTRKGGAHPTAGPSTHAFTPHSSQERRGTSGALAQTRTPAPQPQPGGAGDHAGRTHEHTHTPTPPQGEAGRSRNSNPSTQAHTAHRNRKRRGASGARTQPHTSNKQAET